MDCSMPGFPVLHYLLEFSQTHVHWVNDAIQPSHPLLLPSPPALDLSQHQGLSQWVGSLHQVAKVLKLQPQHQNFSEYSRLISSRIGCSPWGRKESDVTAIELNWTELRIDWCDLFTVQGALKGLLQHHSSKAPNLWCLVFFMVQPSYPYMHDYWENHSLDYTDFCQQSDVSAF